MGRDMHILMLTQFYSPLVGGGAIQARSLSIELVARGHDVAVVTLWHQGQAEFELDRGIRVYRVRSSMGRLPWLFGNRGREYASPFPDPEVTLALRHIIMDEQPEIIHAHNWLVHSFLPLKVWSGARLVVTLHSYDLACPKTTLLHHGVCCHGPGLKKCLGCAAQDYGVAKGIPIVLSHRLMRPIMRSLVDTFLPVSHAAAAGNGLPADNMPFQVIPNFLPSDVGAPAGDVDTYLSQLPAEDYLLFVGALNPLKGVDVLLRAYAGLTNAPPLVLIGYQNTEWSILNIGCPENVYVFKNWPRDAIMQALRRSIMTLAPSVVPETFGMVVMEAMWAGRPVIASRIGGMVDLVADGETGLLVKPGDPDALRGAIERLLGNPELRNRMGLAALRRVAEFQASTVVSRIEQAYQQVLS